MRQLGTDGEQGACLDLAGALFFGPRDFVDIPDALLCKNVTDGRKESGTDRQDRKKDLEITAVSAAGRRDPVAD